MNQFENYAKSAAFRLDLSSGMIAVLIHLHSDDIGPDEEKRLVMTPYLALCRRGLIEWRGEGIDKHGPYVTEAGHKVYELLLLAGYKQ